MEQNREPRHTLWDIWPNEGLGVWLECRVLAYLEKNLSQKRAGGVS
jgi:hypothetical protein